MNYLKNGYLLLNKFIVLSKLDDYNNVNILKQGILSLYQNKNTLRILEKSIEGVFFLVKDTLAISKLNNIILNLNKRFIINFKLMLKYSHHKLIFFILKKTCN